MECLAVITVAAMLVFAGFAQIQDLNPFLWAALALVVYLGPPAYLMYSGKANAEELHWVWASSYVGLFVLFIVQSVAAAVKRQRNR